MNERSGRTTRLLKLLIQAMIAGNNGSGIFVIAYPNQFRYIVHNLLPKIMGELGLQYDLHEYLVGFSGGVIEFVTPSNLEQVVTRHFGSLVAIDHYVYETASEREWIALRRVARYEKII